MELLRVLLRAGPLDIRCYEHSDSSQATVGYLYISFEAFAARVASGEAARRDLYIAGHTHEQAPEGEFATFQRLCAALCALQELEAVLGGLPRPHPTTSCGQPAGAGASPLSVWLGPSGHREQLHYDPYDNVHVVVVGRKLWRLFPPTARNLVACKPFPIWNRWRDRDSASAGLTGEPNFARRTADESVRSGAHGAVTIALDAGDSIFVPAFWWHEVTTAAAHDVTTAAARQHPRPTRELAEARADPELESRIRAILPDLAISINHFGAEKAAAWGATQAWQRARLELYEMWNRGNLETVYAECPAPSDEITLT